MRGDQGGGRHVDHRDELVEGRLDRVPSLHSH